MRSTTAWTVVAGAAAGIGNSGDGGNRRLMFGSAAKTKKRSAGFSVEPISARSFSTSRLPRSLVNPLPAMSYTTRESFFTWRRSAVAGAPRRPEATRGVSDETDTVVPSAAINCRFAHTGSTRSGAFEPVSATIR